MGWDTLTVDNYLPIRIIRLILHNLQMEEKKERRARGRLLVVDLLATSVVGYAYLDKRELPEECSCPSTPPVLLESAADVAFALVPPPPSGPLDKWPLFLL